MKMCKEGYDILIEREGLYLNAYKCPAGVWTIGIGTTYYPDKTPVKKSDTCTEEQAYEWLDYELAEKAATIEKWINNNKLSLNRNQFSALLCFAYNLGCGPIIDSERSLSQAIISGKGIREAFMLYTKAKVKVFGIPVMRELKGLVTRRKLEAWLYFKEEV